MKKKFLSLTMAVVFMSALLIPLTASAVPTLEQVMSRENVPFSDLRIRVEAESFDRAAGEGVGYHDLNPEAQIANATYKAKIHTSFALHASYAPVEVLHLNLSSNPDCYLTFVEMDEGEWMRYTVNVPEAGEYRFGPSVASAEAVSMTVSVNGGEEQAIECPKLAVNFDSGYNFQNFRVRNSYETWITLNAGVNTFVVKNTGAFFYMDAIDITNRYLLEGEMSAASSKCDVNPTPRRSSGCNAVAVQPTGWAEWNVNIREGGRYNIEIISCDGNEIDCRGNFMIDGKMVAEGFTYPKAPRIAEDNNNRSGNPAIAGWQWLELLSGVTFTAGEHVVRLAYNDGPGIPVDAVVLTRAGDLAPWETGVDVEQSAVAEFFAALAATENAAEAERVIGENAETLRLDPSLELMDIADKSKFYRHLAGKLYGSYQEFITDFGRYVYFETLNQCGTAQIGDILSDNGKCSYLGLEGGKLNLLSAGEARNEFLAEIAAQDDLQTVDKLRELIDEIFPGYYWSSKDGGEISLVSDTKSAYASSGIEIPLRFTELAGNVSEVNLILEGDNAFFRGIKQELSVEGETSVTTEDGKAMLKFAANRPADGNKLGSFIMTSPSAVGDYSVRVSGGDITFVISGYKVTLPLTPSTIEIALKDTPKGSVTHGGSGGGSSKGSGAKYSPIALPDPGQSDDPNGEDNKPEADEPFTDMQQAQWAAESVRFLKERGIVSENAEKTFRPNDSITREEFLKMTVMAVGALADDAEADFGDVTKENWCYPYVASAQKLGIVNGDADGNFGVGQNITRQDMAVILFRALSLTKSDLDAQNGEQESFADDASIADYAKEAVYTMRSMNMINGVGDNRFEPGGSATRAAAAKMIYEMIKAVGI